MSKLIEIFKQALISLGLKIQELGQGKIKKVQMKRGHYYCYVISNVCVRYCYIFDYDSKMGYNVGTYWVSNDFVNKCYSHITPISKILYESITEVKKYKKNIGMAKWID